MRAWLALYALRFGGWLLHKATDCPLVLTLEVRDESDDFGGWLMSRYYGIPTEVEAEWHESS